MGELAALEGVKMPTATSVVAGLVRIGLVERLADPNDRRRVLVDLTSDGRSQIAALAAERDQEFARLLADLRPEDRSLLAAAAPAMSRLLAVEAANGLPAKITGQH